MSTNNDFTTPAATPVTAPSTSTPATPSPRCRAMMYEQQIAHLPAGHTYNDVKDIVEKTIQPARWAMILHDQDIDDNGNPAADHLHVMMEFDNPRYLSAIAKLLGDKTERIEKWNGRVDNGFAYLVHGTASAQQKHQYDPTTVDASFDFLAWFVQMSFIFSNAKAPHGKDFVPTLLDMMLDGKIDRDGVIKQLHGSELARYAKQIETVWAQRMRNEAEAWRKQMQEAGTPVNVTWLFGPAGTGKTSFARELAEQEQRAYFISGSTRDPFQGYAGQHIVILDELRPSSIPEYADLLRLLDPFGSDVMAPSRYQDKAIMADTIFVTSPYDPAAFYAAMFRGYPRDVRAVDGLGQLVRRVSMVIEMDENLITLMEYHEQGKGYLPSSEPSRPNPYSQKARKGPPLDCVTEFNRLFDPPADDDAANGGGIDDDPQTDEDTAPTE